MRDSAEERRQEKLELMAHQIRNGTLVIREMTPEERELYPPPPRQAAVGVVTPTSRQLTCGRRSAHGAAASSWAASE